VAFFLGVCGWADATTVPRLFLGVFVVLTGGGSGVCVCLEL